MPDAGRYYYVPNPHEVERRRRAEQRKEARRWRGWNHHNTKTAPAASGTLKGVER